MRSPRAHWVLGSIGVFLGAGIVSLAQRLVGTGLADLRGALGLGFDEAAWIPTAFDMALMFMGPFTVYLGGLLGARRVLLVTIPIYALASFLIPFTTSYASLLALQAVAGLAAGTFYPLSLSYALQALPPKYTVYGIAVYSLEILSSLGVGTALQGWFVEHWSNRWIFWTGPALSLVMLSLIYFAVANPEKRPPGPKPKLDFTGFFFASVGLSLLFGALEQGERLDWLHSGTIVAMLASGGFLVIAAIVRRAVSPNPLVDLKSLLRRNTLALGYGLFTFRFVLLAVVFLVPGFLGAVQSYRALETGRVLSWSLGPFLLAGLVASRVMRRIDARVVAAIGLALVGGSTLLDSRVTSAWVGEDFFRPQLLLAAGLAFTLVATVGLIAQQALDSGAALHPVEALTYVAFFQTVRLFGGQAGTTLLQRFVNVREQFHSNLLGRGVQAGDFATDERLRALSAGLLGSSRGLEDAQARAVALLGGQVRQQAFTLAYADAFTLVAWACCGYLLVLFVMKPMKIYFDSTASAAQR